MIALDIKNSFNSSTWNKVIRQMYRRGIFQYLINLDESYLSVRNHKKRRNLIDIESTTRINAGTLTMKYALLTVRLREEAVSIGTWPSWWKLRSSSKRVAQGETK